MLHAFEYNHFFDVVYQTKNEIFAPIIMVKGQVTYFVYRDQNKYHYKTYAI